MTDAPNPEHALPVVERLQVRMPGHDRDRSLGHLGAAWIEHHCRHGFGDVNGQRVELDQDFYDIVVDTYCLDESGRRLYRTVVICRPKGSAKSELGGFVSMFDAMGPSRFAGWAKGGEEYRDGDFVYSYQPGEPMGRRITSPFVRMLATEESQVQTFYRNTWGANLDPWGDSPLATRPGAQRFDTFAKLPEGGEVAPSTAGAASKDGGLETIVIADEPHLYDTAQLRLMYETVDQNLGKRKDAEPWMLLCSTMYADGADSILERLHKLALAIKEGQPNPGLLWDSIHAGVITDLSDEARLRAVLRGVFAEREWVDYDRYVSRATDPTKDPANFRRFFLNQRGGAATAFLTPVEVAAMAAEPVSPLRKGETITLGMDYAPGTSGGGRAKGSRAFRLPDSTALIAVRISDMTIHKIGLWEAPASAVRTGWNPPDDEIDATLDHAFTTYNVIGVFADPAHQEARLNRLTAKHHARLKVKSSADAPMKHYTGGGGTARFAKAIDAFYAAATTGALRMEADPALMRHFGNGRRQLTRYGVAIYKENPESANKIDALISAILAYAAAALAQNKGVGQQQTIRRRLGNIH